MGITFEDMEPQAREILGLSEGGEDVDQDFALIKALVEASQAEYDAPEQRTRAIYNAYHADDILTCIRLNAGTEVKNGETVTDRVGYTPEKSRFFMMAKADQLSRAVATEHGQSVVSDIASKVDEIQLLLDTKTMGPTAFERVANDHGVKLPEGFANFLKRHTNHGPQAARILRATDLVVGLDNQFQGLLSKGEAMLQAEGWQPPYDELGAHA